MIVVPKAPLDQQVLDEWAGIIAAGAIRSSSLGCLRALIQRAQAGRFTPERAVRVAQSRKAQQRLVTMQAQSAPAPGPVDPDNPLVRRLADLASKRASRE